MTVDTTIRCHDCGCFGNVKFHQCGDDRFRHPSDTSSVCSNILCDECKKENGECRSCRSAKYAARMEKEKIESRNKKISLSRAKDFSLIWRWGFIGAISFFCYWSFRLGVIGLGYMEDVFCITWAFTMIWFIVLIPKILYVLMKFLPGGKSRK